MAEPLTEAFIEIVALAERLGVRNISKMPGCWEHQVDSLWWIAVNGKDVATKSSHGGTVPPFSAYVEFNGWPAGVIDPYGGTLVAGDAANEDAFIAALKGDTDA